MNHKFDPIKLAGGAIWWAAVIGLLFITWVNLEFLLYLFRETWLGFFIDPAVLERDALTIPLVVSPIRGMILLFSLFVLSYPVVKDVQRTLIADGNQFNIKGLVQPVLVFIALIIIFAPGEINGLAIEYANTSLVMFTRMTTVVDRYRFLLPATANLFFFRGEFLYRIFSLLCSLLTIIVLRYWFITNKVQVSPWQLLSLCTLSFIFYHFELPGYPDVLVNILILAAFTFAADTRSKLSLFTLSLASHEAGLIIWCALALILLDTKGLIQFMIIAGIYLMLLLAFNNGVAGLMEEREVFGMSGPLWVINNPGREVLGIFFSFKAMWLVVLGALWYLFSKKRLTEAFQILAILSAGVVMTILGIDTSRLLGWAFMAVLLSWKTLEFSEGRWKKLIPVALILNLIVPSVTVFLYGSVLPPGIYEKIVNFVFNFTGSIFNWVPNN